MNRPTAPAIAAVLDPPNQPQAKGPTVTTATKTHEASLIYLDPRPLLDAAGNIRADVGDIGDLTKSVKAIGVLEPIVVIPTDDGYRLVAGKRRVAASVAAGLDQVPAISRPDLAGVRTEIAAQLVENEHRIPLSDAERVAGYQQMALAGMSAASIAKATGVKPAAVKRHLTVGGSELANASLSRFDLTLDQALVLAEFEGQDESVKLLVATAKKDPSRWHHVVSRLRADRDREAARQATVEALTAAGVRVLDADDEAAGALPLHRLLDGDGQPLDAETHAACAGHAVMLDDWRPGQTAYCTDPAAHGHTDRFANRTGAGSAATTAKGPDGKMTEEAKAERRLVIDNNRAWRAADPVRRAYITDLLARKTPPKGTLRYVTTEVLGRPERLSDGKDDIVADLLGVKRADGWGRNVGPAAAHSAPDARLPLILLAQVAASYETTMDVHIWRSAYPDAAGWLQFLATTGYALSAVEQLAIDTAAGTRPAHDSEEDLYDPEDLDHLADDDGGDPDAA
jgi:ParB family chromosome partitioning protein